MTSTGFSVTLSLAGVRDRAFSMVFSGGNNSEVLKFLYKMGTTTATTIKITITDITNALLDRDFSNLLILSVGQQETGLQLYLHHVAPHRQLAVHY